MAKHAYAKAQVVSNLAKTYEAPDRALNVCGTARDFVGPSYVLARAVACVAEAVDFVVGADGDSVVAACSSRYQDYG